MQLPINKDGNIELDLFQIVSEIIGKATAEERQVMVEYFGLQEPIRKWMIERLADEYSRPSYCEEIHNDRLDFLKRIKDEELSFYADLIALIVADEKRHNKAYWELYRWCQSENITRRASFPHQSLKGSDWNWKNEVALIVTGIIRRERPDLLEANIPDEPPLWQGTQ